MIYTNQQDFASNLKNAMDRNDLQAVRELMGAMIGGLMVSNKAGLLKAVQTIKPAIPNNITDDQLLSIVSTGVVSNPQFTNLVLNLQQRKDGDWNKGYFNDDWISGALSAVGDISKGVTGYLANSTTAAANLATAQIGLQATQSNNATAIANTKAAADAAALANATKIKEIAAQAAAIKDTNAANIAIKKLEVEAAKAAASGNAAQQAAIQSQIDALNAKKGSGMLWPILGGVVVLGLIGGGIYWYMSKNKGGAAVAIEPAAALPAVTT